MDLSDKDKKILLIVIVIVLICICCCYCYRDMVYKNAQTKSEDHLPQFIISF